MKKIKISPFIPANIEVEKKGETQAKITVYPFESGYAITVAHPIKRLLLSSSVGFAPIALKIDGVAHEFDDVRGMLEDVSEFILNLKNIRFGLKNDSKRATVSYSFSGNKEIKGSDLETDEVEVVYGDMHLATINDDTQLNFTLIIEKGMGYVPSEDIREMIDTSFIPLDAYFTPILRAVYNIEKMLVEDNPNYEKLIFEVVTDGQQDAEFIFRESIKSLYDQLSIFNKELNIASNQSTAKVENDGEIKKLLTNIDDLNLSARSHNCLTRAYIKYLGDLVLMSEKEVMEIKNLGKKSLDEIKEKMEELGYPIGTVLPEDQAGMLRSKLAQLKDK